MPKYKIIVMRTVSTNNFITIDIDADNVKQAENLAIARADKLAWPELTGVVSYDAWRCSLIDPD